jgi:hypothetical protein
MADWQEEQGGCHGGSNAFADNPTMQDITIWGKKQSGINLRE